MLPGLLFDFGKAFEELIDLDESDVGESGVKDRYRFFLDDREDE